MKCVRILNEMCAHSESELLEYDCNTRRDAGSCLKRFLLSQSAGALKGIPRQSIDTLCVLYEHARHEVTVIYLLISYLPVSVLREVST